MQDCDKASVAFEADPVHDLRVAIRRCRSMADGFLSVDPDPAWKQMKRLAMPLFRSLGDLRDTQVMCEWLAKLAPAGDPVAEIIATCLRHQEAQLKVSAEKELAKFDRQHEFPKDLARARSDERRADQHAAPAVGDQFDRAPVKVVDVATDRLCRIGAGDGDVDVLRASGRF